MAKIIKCANMCIPPHMSEGWVSYYQLEKDHCGVHSNGDFSWDDSGRTGTPEEIAQSELTDLRAQLTEAQTLAAAKKVCEDAGMVCVPRGEIIRAFDAEGNLECVLCGACTDRDKPGELEHRECCFMLSAAAESGGG